MPDTFGLLDLPVPAPDQPRDVAVGDPLLDLVAAFMKAVLNAELKDAWATVVPARGKANNAPALSVPVPFTSTHDPEEASFSSEKTPCLYVYRLDDPPPTRIRITQGWEVVRSAVGLLFVPPPPTQDKQRLRTNMRNAFDKAIRGAVRDGRHPAWIVAGDTYYDPDIYGSVFLRHAKLQSWTFVGVRRHPILIEDEEGNKQPPFPALLATILVDEQRVKGTQGTYPIDHIEGSVSIGPIADPLTFGSYDFKTTLASISPSSGPTAGGTTVTISGAQFFVDDDGEGLSVATSDGVALTDVELVDERTITAVMPAHAAGVVGLVVTLPNTSTASIANAFTYA